MNHDGATADGRSFRQRAVGARFELIVVDDDILLEARIVVPDLDPETVAAAASRNLAIDAGQQKFIVASAIQGARALELSAGPADDQPVVRVAVKAQIGALKMELGRPGGDLRAFLILRHEAEGRSAGRAEIVLERSGWRFDPAATGDESRRRIVDHDVAADLTGLPGGVGN